MGFQNIYLADAQNSVLPIGGPESPVRYYAVLVAGRNQLSAIQQVYSDAFVLQTVRGEVISIGTFNSLRSAQEQVTQAQNLGFQAEVIDASERL